MVTVRIGPYKIPVVRRSTPGAFGYWDNENKQIIISPEVVGVAYRETLLHECMHAVSDMYDLGLTEQQVCALAVGLTQCMDSIGDED
jgi:hypothetical protein